MAFRKVMGSYPTGVTVATARVDEAEAGSSEALAFCRGSYGAVAR